MTADPRLVVVVPTRRRPHNIPPLIEAHMATRQGEHSLLEVVVDGDPDYEAYQTALQPMVGKKCYAAVRRMDERRGMCGTLNERVAGPLGWAKHRAADIVGFMGDDHRPRTFGWDQAIIDAMPPLGVVYTDDGFQGPNLPTSVFMDAELIRRLGWMVPPGIGHLFCDNAWKTLGEALGTLVYLPDVLIEHMHPHADKAPMDAGYAEVNSARQWEADEAAVRKWVAADLPRDVARVKGGGA